MGYISGFSGAISVSVSSALVVLLASPVLGFAAESAGRIQFERGLAPAQVAGMQRDREVLQSFDLSSRAPQLKALKNLLGVSSLSSEQLAEWLEDRVQAVVGENFVASRQRVVLRPLYSYANPTKFPYVEIADPSPIKKGVVVMSNVGAGTYAAGKESGLLYGLQINGIGTIPMTSPRSGVIKIGPGLFLGRRVVDSKDPSATVNSITRLSTFFHEARHSDGNSASLGFFHAVCPMGHSFEGSHSCDRNRNGPYTVGGAIMQAMAESCKTCTVAHREALRVLYLDSFNRVLPNNLDGTVSRNWDPSPEGRRQ